MELFTTFFVAPNTRGEKMPKRQLKITEAEYKEYCERVLRLNELGVPTGSVHRPSPQKARLALRIDEESARIYELPSGMVAVVVPATMRVLVSGILITDVVGFIPRFDCSIELCDPTDYPDLIDEIRHNPRTELLNNLLTSETPLRPCQPQGVIVAHGTAFVPHECPDELPVPIEFLLTDERSKELCFKFEVRLDRILRRKHEQRRLKCRERIGWTERTGIFAPARAKLEFRRVVRRKKLSTFGKLAVRMTENLAKQARRPTVRVTKRCTRPTY